MRGGYILVQTLIVVACLVALMATLAGHQRAVIKETSDTLLRRRAELAARSGLERALATLRSANTDLAVRTDDWATLGDGAKEEFNLGDSTFRLQIVDAGALLNINTASSAQLQDLPLTQEEIDCLLDWRESSLTARSDGAKDAYYNSLKEPYNARLGSLATVSELLLIKGWTGRMVYLPRTDVSGVVALPTDTSGKTLPLAAILTVDSGAPNTTASGASRLNLSRPGVGPASIDNLGVPAAMAKRIADGEPYTAFASLLSIPGMTLDIAKVLLNSVTVSSSTRLNGKININTASAAVLKTVPGMTTDIANSIVSQQSSSFSTLGAITGVAGISTSALALMADDITVGADTWIVRVLGECGGVSVPIEAVVYVSGSRPLVRNWEPANAAGIPAWWGWDAVASETVDLEIPK